MSYFANECFVCKSTDTLKICGSCNMISYCGSNHQKLDWPNHKDFCNAISFILQETGLSHVYENHVNSDLDKWTAERERMSALIESALDRPLELHEEQMILLPRSCFVCHDTNQENLTHCPNCMCVNFCEKHESSAEHDRDCASLKLFHDLDGKIQDPSTLRIILSIIKKIVAFTFDDPARVPPSMREYLDQLIIGDDAIFIQSCTSNMLSMPLTLFNALKKLNLDSASALILHITCDLPDSIVWEILLHFLPTLNFLKIIFTNQPESNKVKMKLCSECSERDKKLILQTKDLTYEEFIQDELYTEPDVLAHLPADFAENELEIMSRVECPLVLTSVTESKMQQVAESLRSTFWSNLIIHEGANDFGALEPLREWTNGGVGKINQFMIVTEGRSDQCRAKRFPNDSPLLMKKQAGEFWDQQHFFFSHICRKCRAKSSIITCKYCNMVFYCNDLHRREDWFHHKDLCKLIQKLLLDSGRRNVFAGELDLMECEQVNPEVWLQAKLNVLEKVDSGMERKLSVYEEQMLLFPKTCFACHESDLLKLYICRCGIPLCKIHKDFRGHKSICEEYHLGYLLHENEEIVTSVPEFQFVPGFDYSLPNSIQEFLESWINFADGMSNIQKILLTELLTRPLTLLDAMRKLPIAESDSIAIHVIGSGNSNFTEDEFWDVLLFWLKDVEKVSVTFLGLETRALNFSRDVDSKILSCKSYPLTYEQFVLGKFFSRPDVIIGYDLDIHECDLNACCCMKDIVTIKKMNVPFVLTSGTKERARKDHRKIARIFETPIAPDFAYLNPFASLEPVRDFETECLRYLNKCVVIYLEWTPTTDENVDIFREQVDTSRSFELEKKLAEMLFTKSKNDEVEENDEVEKKSRDSDEEELKPQISSVFAASSELKYLLQDCGYISKPRTENSNKRRILDEPDLQFVKNEKIIETNVVEEENEINLSEDVEAKCDEIFESLLDSRKTENEIEMEEKEIPDVEIYESTENDRNFGKLEYDDRNSRSRTLEIKSRHEKRTGKLNKITEEEFEETKLEKSDPPVADSKKTTAINGFMKNLLKFKANNSESDNQSQDFGKAKKEKVENENKNELPKLSMKLPNTENAFKSEPKNELNFEFETKNTKVTSETEKTVQFPQPKMDLKKQCNNEVKTKNLNSESKRNSSSDIFKSNAELKRLLANFKNASNSNGLSHSANKKCEISEPLENELSNLKIVENNKSEEEIIDKKFTSSNLEIVDLAKLENPEKNLETSLPVEKMFKFETEISCLDIHENKHFKNSSENLDEKSPEELESKNELKEEKVEKKVFFENEPKEGISKDSEMNGKLKEENFLSQEEMEQTYFKQNSQENLELKTEPEESENENKIFNHNTENVVKENNLEIEPNNGNGNLEQNFEDEDRKIIQENSPENFEKHLIENQEDLKIDVQNSSEKIEQESIKNQEDREIDVQNSSENFEKLIDNQDRKIDVQNSFENFYQPIITTQEDRNFDVQNSSEKFEQPIIENQEDIKIDVQNSSAFFEEPIENQGDKKIDVQNSSEKFGQWPIIENQEDTKIDVQNSSEKFGQQPIIENQEDIKIDVQNSSEFFEEPIENQEDKEIDVQNSSEKFGQQPIIENQEDIKIDVQNSSEKFGQQPIIENQEDIKIDVQNSSAFFEQPIENQEDKKIDVQNSSENFEQQPIIENQEDTKIDVQNSPENFKLIENQEDRKIDVQNSSENFEQHPVENQEDEKIDVQNSFKNFEHQLIKNPEYRKIDVQNSSEEFGQQPIIENQEDKKIDVQNSSENFEYQPIIKNQEAVISIEPERNIDNVIQFQKLQLDKMFKFPINEEDAEISDLNLNGTNTDEKLNLTDVDSSSNEIQISQSGEISKSENNSSSEATKSDLELLNVDVSNELNETESSTKNQSVPESSAIQDPVVSVDLFREILLLKEEIKRLKENEKRIETENSRLKDEVNHFRDERKFL